MSATAQLPALLEQATAEQPRARAALSAAFAGRPTHAYALIGPAGSGKSRAARAFAAELLAEGSGDPESTRRRVLTDPSPHPDLTWVRPPGNQHLVTEIREEVIGAVAYRPYESERRVFVIEAADAMAEESQNALLKTLEEPPPHVHLLLISAEPDGLLETVRSRCQRISFDSLPTDAAERRLAETVAGPPELIAALVALSGSDLELARFLAEERGARLRELAERCIRASLAGEIAERPWTDLLKLAETIGAERAAEVEALAAERAEQVGKGRAASRVKREGEEAAKRADRQARTEAIDTSLALVAAWCRDLAAVASGAPEAVRNIDRREALEQDAGRVPVAAALEIAELAMQMRRRLEVNVKEELALEALFHRAASLLGSRA